VRTSSAAGRATSIMAAQPGRKGSPPGRKVRRWVAAAVSMSPTRQRLIAERITASRSAEVRPPPSSRTPPHSICVDYIRARLPCNLVCLYAPAPGGRGDAFGATPGDQAPYQGKGKSCWLCERCGSYPPPRSVGRNVGSRPAGIRPGPRPGRAFVLLNDDDNAPVTPAPGPAPESRQRPGQRNRPRRGPGRHRCPARAGRRTGWGTLASWTLMWW